MQRIKAFHDEVLDVVEGKINDWLGENPNFKIINMFVSPDESEHYIIVLYEIKDQLDKN